MQKVKAKTLLQLFLSFFKIGLFTFGGGYAMLSLIEREAVENKGWLTADEMAEMVIIAESTPGAIAINSATFIGYKQCGVLGSLIATLGVVLPSFIIISICYFFFNAFKSNVYVAAAFKGIRCAVVALVFNAVLKLFKPMPKTVYTLIITVAAFAVALLTDFSSIYIILIGGALGIILFVLTKTGQIDKAEELSDKAEALTDKTDEAQINGKDENEAQSGEDNV